MNIRVPPSLTGAQVRQSFLDFFAERGHAIVPSASLIPADDPTLLFTNSGMVQFKDVFLNTGTRPYRRAADSQKSMRVAGKHNDLDDVGRDDTHHTFFEMLGNWSFGDYYKQDAIAWAWQLLTGVWGLPKDRLWATCFRDEQGIVPEDDEAAQCWLQQPGFDPQHLLFFGRKDNFMFIHPVLRLDTQALNAHLDDTVAQKKAHLVNALKAVGRQDLAVKHILGDGGAQADVRKTLMSNAQFATMLKGLDVEAPTKISPTTGKLTLALAKTDEGFKALLEHEDLRVQALCAARIGTKSTLEETRTQRFLDIAGRGLLPIPLKYYAAHTGRWGGTDSVNLQNLPSRGANAGKLKKAIQAPEGYVFIDSDSSQIEARTLAWEAGQDDLVAAFAKGEDVYKIMASAIYNKPSIDITAAERFVGKTTILGAGYGMGGPKFQAQLRTFGTTIETGEAAHIVSTYRTTYPKIPQLWREAHEALRCMVKGMTMNLCRGDLLTVDAQGILLPNGLHIFYNDLQEIVDTDGKKQFVYQTRKGANKIYGGKVVENFTQAIARCIIGDQMRKIAKRYRVVLTVHDAIGIVARHEEAGEARDYVESCMRWVPSWAQGLPVNCESGMGASYGDC